MRPLIFQNRLYFRKVTFCFIFEYAFFPFELYSSFEILLFIVSYIHIEICFFIGEIGAVLSLWILSPVESKNRPLNGWEKKQYKKITIVITLICMWIEIIFSLCDRKSFAIAIGTGVMVTAITQSSYWLKIKKERRR